MVESNGRRTRRTFSEHLALALATVGGVGYLPVAPGTWGTLAAIPICMAVSVPGSLWFYMSALLVVTLAGIWAAGVAERVLGKKDAGPVVIDEVAGFLVTMLLVPITALHLVAGFFLFRLFDVVKPYPARRLERVPGGPGVMLDDLAAGVYANLALQIGAYFLPLGG